MKLFILMFCIFFSTLASAEIYEIIDGNGHKMYTDKPPLNEPEAKPVSVAPETGNSWENDSLQEQNNQYYDELQQKQQVQEEEQQRQIIEENHEQQNTIDAVIAAEKAFEEAKEVQAGDYFPNKNGGMIHTQEYLDRVKSAEEALNRARESASQY
jgi:hypothetical protein